MKMELTLKLDKNTIRLLMEVWMSEMRKETNKKSLAARKGWETRRRRRQKKAIERYKKMKRAKK